MPIPGPARLVRHRVEQPALGAVARALDDPSAGRALRQPLGHRERDECAAHADHGGDDEQRGDVDAPAPGLEHLIETEDAKRDVQYEQDGEVRRNEQEYPRHGVRVLPAGQDGRRISVVPTIQCGDKVH